MGRLRLLLIIARWSVSLATATAVTSRSGIVCAEPTRAELNKARAQFQQGLALETAGDWAGALRLFQEVAAVRMTPQVRFNIALCEEQLGRLAVALGDYKLALAEAEAAKIGVIIEQAPGKIEALNVRVPKVTVRRGPGAEFATITLDSIALGAASVGSEMPVDPGPHTLEARAAGFTPFLNTFHINEREKKTVNVTLAKSSAPSVANTDESPAANARVESSAEEPAPVSSGGSILPYVLWGVGAASLAASAGFYFGMRGQAISDLDKMCGGDRDHCVSDYQSNPEWQSTTNRANTGTILSAGFLAAGVVAVGTGVVLFLLDKPASPPPKVEAWLSGGSSSLGLGVRGSF